MNIRKLSILLAIIAMVPEIRSQDFHFSGFLPNIVYVNPGYTAMPSSGEVGLTYRNQWPGISATFVTYGAYLVVPVKTLHSGFGIVATNDVQGGGVINQTSAGLMYGYQIKLDRNWKVGAGLYASWNMKRFNANDLQFRSDILQDLGYSYGTTIYPNYSRNYPDFSAGVVVQNQEHMSFGFSVCHLTRPVYTSDVEINKRLPVKYTAFASRKIGDVRSSQSGLIWEPAVFYSFQGRNQEFIWGTSVYMASKFSIGGWLRHNQTFHFDAFILSAGISWEKYNIGYSYDVNLKKINFMSTKMAAHEVTFLYRFEYKDEHRVKRFGKSECPAY